jgi:hypothetical protein
MNKHKFKSVVVGIEMYKKLTNLAKTGFEFSVSRAAVVNHLIDKATRSKRSTAGRKPTPNELEASAAQTKAFDPAQLEA